MNGMVYNIQLNNSLEVLTLHPIALHTPTPSQASARAREVTQGLVKEAVKCSHPKFFLDTDSLSTSCQKVRNIAVSNESVCKI